MKRINLSEYNPNMGILIDVQNEVEYKESPTKGSINIYVDKLLMNHKYYLDKNKTYYIVCRNGHLSKRAVQILSYYGYDVIQVIR